MHYPSQLLIIATLSIITGCNNNSNKSATTQSMEISAPQPATIDTNIAKVYVSADEKIMVNCKEASLSELEADLKKLPAKGMVYYSRANASKEPPAIAKQAVELIAQRGLPIQFYTDATFTQVVKLK